jgi:hypothetical protein
MSRIPYSPRMDWEAIGAIGEIVGAAAVVVTLGYLATQIQYAKIAASDSNRLIRASGVREMYLAQAQDPTLAMSLAAFDSTADAYYRAYAAEFGTTVEQAICTDSQNQYYFWLHWGQFASLKTTADEEELRNVARGFYSVPYVRYSWDTSPYAKTLLEPRFIDFIDQILAETPDVPRV